MDRFKKKIGDILVLCFYDEEGGEREVQRFYLCYFLSLLSVFGECVCVCVEWIVLYTKIHFCFVIFKAWHIERILRCS